MNFPVDGKSPFSFHAEVAGLEPEIGDELLSVAEGCKWTQRELRTAVARYKLAEKHAAIAEAARGSNVSGQFCLIYADPPWSFQTYSELGKQLGPEQHYPTLPFEEIAQLDVDGRTVDQLAYKDAALFMWCTSSNLELALPILRCWGFTYRTHLVWDKMRTGTGYVFLNQHELLLYAKRGAFPMPEVKLSSLISVERGAHSEKPAEVRQALEIHVPAAWAGQPARAVCPRRGARMVDVGQRGMIESSFITLTPHALSWCGTVKAFRNKWTMEPVSDDEQMRSVAAEIAVAQFLDMPGFEFARQYQEHGHHDVRTKTGLKVDVKSSSHAKARRLIWPLSKNDDWPLRHFDLLVFCKTHELPIVELVGWVYKQEFKVRRLISTGADGITAGTWYMEAAQLRDMDTLPGSLTAERLGVGVAV